MSDTPTDDEREALAAFVTARLRDNGYEVPESEVRLALANWDALRAPLRRSEVPEPSPAWLIYEVDGTAWSAVPKVIAVAGSEEAAERIVGEASGYYSRHAKKVEVES